MLILGTICFVVLPFIIQKFRKPSWNSLGTEFVPFHWDNSAEAAQNRLEAAEQFASENSSNPDAAKFVAYAKESIPASSSK